MRVLPLAHVVQLDSVTGFLELGFRHILGGADHILFIVALLLSCASLRQVSKLTLAFTAAHSVTLILAGSGVLVIAGAVVEPAIAFSISIVAIRAAFFQRPGTAADKKAIVLVFAVGLFHGLGFAGLLGEVEIPDDKFLASLLLFNVSIELGQLCIVALGLLVVNALRQSSWFEIIMKVSAIVLAVIGGLWGMARIAGAA